jgi:[ribosomal protein S5]-alanine N-acetyltransferase
VSTGVADQRARGRIYLRSPVPADEREFVAAVRSSRTLHGLWMSAPQTSAQFRAYLKRMQEPNNVSFIVCRRDHDAMVGVVSITNIVMGLFCSGYLSYYAFAGQERQGLMREGLLAAKRHAFRTLKLHRLEANIQPGNVASIALVAACGFSKEGFSPRYLKIAGRWRDHERWAVVAD